MDPVVEVTRQPDTAEVLHHHGEQVLRGDRAGEGRPGVDGRASVLSGPCAPPPSRGQVGKPPRVGLAKGLMAL